MAPSSELSLNFDTTGEILSSNPGESVLELTDEVQIDIDSPLPNSSDVLDRLNLQGQLVAEINAGGKLFFLIDNRSTAANRDFILADEDYSAEDGKGYKGFGIGQALVIGQSKFKDKFFYPRSVSENHFGIAYTSDGLIVRNLQEDNLTIVNARIIRSSHEEVESLHTPSASDGRTAVLEGRLEEDPRFSEKDEHAPYGYFEGLPIIGRDSPTLDGGVYLGGTAREALVADGQSETMKALYAKISADIRSAYPENGPLPLIGVLEKVMEGVKKAMPHYGSEEEAISSRYYGDQLVPISTYVEAGAGVCRHRGVAAALTIAFLSEKLVADGFIPGTIGVERNNNRAQGAHGWAIYKAMIGNRPLSIVIDPMQGFVGTKERARREDRWEYLLSTD